MELKGIRIVSDGTAFGTKVFAEDGEDLTAKLKVRSIQWAHGAGDTPVATLECIASSIEVTSVDATVTS